MQSAPREYEAVVIVASAAGIPAPTVRSSLPSDFPTPVFNVQHRISGGPRQLSKALPRSTKLALKEAQEGNEAAAV
jgi:chemotaxis response regulator CheB